MQKYNYHPIANIFPMADKNSFNILKEDIRKNGQLFPIVLYEEMILDGRTRYEACLELDIPFELDMYLGDDPIGYVTSLNLNRRHLTESQRAMVAGRLAELGRGNPKPQGLKSRNKKEANPPIGASSTQEEAAKTMNVSERSVQRAKKILKSNDKELISSVDKGDISLNKAVNKLNNENKIEKRKKQEEKQIKETPDCFVSFKSSLNIWINELEKAGKNKKKVLKLIKQLQDSLDLYIGNL